VFGNCFRRSWSQSSQVQIGTVPIIRVRVPAAYVSSAHMMFLAFFAFNGINNLRAFNIAFGSTPTAPTIHISDGWTLNKTRRGKKGQIRPMIRFRFLFLAARVTTGRASFSGSIYISSNPALGSYDALKRSGTMDHREYSGAAAYLQNAPLHPYTKARFHPAIGITRLGKSHTET
jgi:hypothetical protein